MVVRAVVFDLDGVIRHFDPSHRPAVERRHGLTAGSLEEAAWQPHLSRPVTTGAMTRAQWVSAVGEAVGSHAAAREWLGHAGSVDREMLDVVDEIRAAGLSVSVLTNGTDTVPAELEHHGIAQRFDRVFNSWDLGLAKPDPGVYLRVCGALDVDPTHTFFADDREANVEGARHAGLQACLFVSIDDLRVRLDSVGV